MTRFVVTRVVHTVGVVAAALLIVFVTMHVLQDPARLMLPVNTPEEQLQEFREANGLTGSVWVRTARFVGDVVRGDFGESVWLGEPALGLAADRIPTTMAIVLPATLIGTLAGVAFGAKTGRRPGSVLDRLGQVTSFGLVSAPEFWLAVVAVYVFSLRFDLFPTGGRGGPEHMVLPIALLSVQPFASAALMMRTSVAEESDRQYVLAARAKGLSGIETYRRHVRRNALIPVTTLSLYQLSRLFVGSSIIVEVIFSWPGIGRLALGALERGDVYLITACVFLGAVITALLNLVADVIVLVVDRRARIGETVRAAA